MKDQLITFETAVLAKEKGFFQTEEDYYILMKSKNIINTFYKNGKFIIISMPRIVMAMEKDRPDIDDKYILISPQSLLQKWLREIYNLDVQSYLVEMKSNERQIKQDLDQREYMYRIYKEGIDIFVKLKKDLSYEQALEKGLQEALKLIKL